MPSHGLIGRYGRHCQRTANDWLINFDRNREQIGQVLRPVYGEAAHLWIRRWRLFFLATAGLFGHHGGAVWGVSHYRLRPAAGSRRLGHCRRPR